MEFKPPGLDQELSCLKIKHQIGLRTSGETEFLFEQAVALRDIGRIGGGRSGVERLIVERNSKGACSQPDGQKWGTALPRAGRSGDGGQHLPMRGQKIMTAVPTFAVL